MIKTKRYVRGDYLKIKPKKKAFGEDAHILFGMQFDSAELNPNLHVYTIFEDSQPIALICWYKLWDGVAEIIAIIDEKVSLTSVSFARAMKKFVEFEIELHQLVRVQTTLRITYPEGRKWLQFLGMEKEGLMRKFCADGTDTEIWARVEA